eukprot:gene8219-8411_t
MDNLIGHLNRHSLSSGTKPKTSLHIDTKQSGSFVIPSTRSRTTTPSPRQDYAAGSDDETQTCDREDSESYAKRTITEIETCLGFSFHGNGEEEAAEGITNVELETLNTQVEAALQSGLNFKNKLITNSRKRLQVPAPLETTQDEIADGITDAPVEGLDDSGLEQPIQELEQQQQQPSRLPAVNKGKAPPLGVGLSLTVGSQMETGEWKTNGVWVKKDKAAEDKVPGNLQVISADDLIKVKELGRGCFGSVWLAKWRGVEVALKELLNTGGQDSNPIEVFNEAEKLASLRHPCVMAFYGIVTNPGSCATVAEFICHGSLRSGLQKIKKKGINDKRLRAHIAMQAAQGMEYLHLHYMVHFDLKCDNLLCDLRDLNKPVVKIGDLGLSKKKTGSFISGNMRGTLPWMAPELFPSVPGAASGLHRKEDKVEDRVTEKVDVFSFGVVLWEIWTLGEQPYPNLSLQEIFAGVMTGTLRPSTPHDCDPDWLALMQDCWHGVPGKRPSFTDIITRLEGMLQRCSQQPQLAAGSSAGGASSGALGTAAARTAAPHTPHAPHGPAAAVPHGFAMG